jgi:hypothetical protein
MKFRWSDGYSAAVEFEAFDADGLKTAALDALIDFRLKTVKRYHDGKTHTWKRWALPGQLHLSYGDRWLFIGSAPYWLVGDGEVCPDVAAVQSSASSWWAQGIKLTNHCHALDGLVGDIIGAAFRKEPDSGK